MNFNNGLIHLIKYNENILIKIHFSFLVIVYIFLITVEINNIVFALYIIMLHVAD